jgi:phosphate transport system ATP-binding protein
LAELASPAIRVRNFDLWYGDFQALFAVDIEVKRGLVTSLIGPSGCGKSTLLRSVNRITERLGYVRTSGSIEVMGHDVTASDVELTQLRRAVGMVFQRPNPLPLSIWDNVLYAFRLHRGGRAARGEEHDVAVLVGELVGVSVNVRVGLGVGVAVSVGLGVTV